MQDLELQSKIEYYNYFTIPSGGQYILYEIQNKEYVVLLKFLQSENYTAFFNILDNLIEKSIPTFKTFNFIDKVYTYIAFAYYNIHPIVSISHPKLGSTDLPISNILNDIEESYEQNYIEFEITKSIKVAIHYPRRFYFEDKNPIVDYSTAIHKIAKNGVWQDLSAENSSLLSETLETSIASEIEHIARTSFSKQINAFRLPLMEPVYINTNSAEILYLVCNLMKENLQNYYTGLYVMVHYFKMDKSGFDSLTPSETSILLKIMEEDKQKQSKDSKTGGMTIPSAISDENLFGGA